MSESQIDKNFSPEIMTPEEVALFLRKSTSWVYKHWKELGGRKLGGSLLFPRKEELYERIFGKRKGVEVRLHPGRDQTHGGLVQNQKSSKGGRGKETRRVEKSKTGAGDPNRYGLLDIDK
jgi:hypothetical protein